jgi:RNA polymerase sigma-70 factor (ECF subfamily)
MLKKNRRRRVSTYLPMSTHRPDRGLAEEEGSTMVASTQPLDLTPELQESVVDRARAGDRSAYGELVRRFRPAIYAVLLTRLHDPTEADDVAQEVFLHSMRKLDQLRDARCFGGWLRQIAIRLAFNRLTRHRPLGGGAVNRLALVPDDGEGPLEEMIRAEAQERIRASLARLKPVDRAVLEAFYLRNRSLREMSEEFDVPLGTVKRRLHTARQRLREQLEADSAADLG